MSARTEESRAYFRALGVHLAQLRKDAGITQAELARILGVSQQTVLAYERSTARERFGQLSKTQQRFVAQVIDVLLEMKTSASSVTSK